GARHVLAIVKEWSQMGHEVCLVAGGNIDRIPGVMQIKPPSWIRPGMRLEAVLASLSVYAYVQFRPQVGYVRLSASSSMVPWTLRGLRLPLVFELNGCLLDELRHRGRKEWQVRAVQRVQQEILRDGLLVAVDTNTEQHGREQLGASQTLVVENGADIDVAIAGDRVLARERLGLPADGLIIGFAGTLAMELRFDLLEAALLRLSQKPLLVVAGDGPQRLFFESRTGDKGIVWLGATSHEKAIDVLRAADICVNVREGIPGMKTLEYASVGRRFVTFNVQGVERLTTLYPEHQVAFIVKERTPEALAEALMAALSTEKENGPLPPSAIAKAQGLVSWKHTAVRLIEVLEARNSQ
ncbi:MAG: glycosyltransferase family 4 protein, partial [Myxococcales bacterium]|nr:glycosyltransferase family 4 protein [Myxococcales bacterium]